MIFLASCFSIDLSEEPSALSLHRGPCKHSSTAMSPSCSTRSVFLSSCVVFHAKPLTTIVGNLVAAADTVAAIIVAAYVGADTAIVIGDRLVWSHVVLLLFCRKLHSVVEPTRVRRSRGNSRVIRTWATREPSERGSLCDLNRYW